MPALAELEAAYLALGADAGVAWDGAASPRPARAASTMNVRWKFWEPGLIESKMIRWGTFN